METEFILKQMVNLLHASIYILNPEKRTKKEIGTEAGERILSDEEAEIICEKFILKKKNYPLMRVLDEKLILVEIWNGKQQDEWVCVGPIIPATVSGDEFKRICKKHKYLEKLGIQIGNCPLNTFVSGILLVFWAVTGEEFTAVEFWEKNQEWSEKIQKISARMTMDIFYRQENYGPHNPYEQELREMESIKSGDLDSLKRSIAETYAGEIGILAKDPLRHHRNVAIGNITLASRAAISGGLNIEQAFSMADSFIQQVEEIDNVPEVEMFKREAKYAYARAVSEEQESKKAEGNNPLIAGVKDYIFSHLHDVIQVSDIAEYLHVNADYLSHLFKSHEKVTIKRYILQEKIKRSQNLLRYSDYRLQEIGFYLGFSSQSHFSKTFQEIVGVTPSEYRRQFTGRKNWKVT